MSILSENSIFPLLILLSHVILLKQLFPYSYFIHQSDHTSGAFYGSAFCELASIEDARRVKELNGSIRILNEFRKKGAGRGRKKQPRLARLAYAPLQKEVIWPPPSFHETEYPLIGS